MIRHILFVKFKDNIDSKDLLEARNAFSHIPNQIQGISGFEWGENTSAEGLSQEFTHCIQIVFADEQARQRYLIHPEHQKLKSNLFKVLEKIIVVDYAI